jgi:ABC-type antimicrobial peptide transport system permease subunit
VRVSSTRSTSSSTSSPPSWRPPTVVLGVLAAVLPARRAARLEIIAALKYE